MRKIYRCPPDGTLSATHLRVRQVRNPTKSEVRNRNNRSNSSCHLKWLVTGGPPTLSERTYAAVPLYLAFRALSLTWFFNMQAPFSGLRIALAGKELETGCQAVVWTEGSGRSLSIFMIDLVALCSKSAMAHCKLKRQSACML